MTLDPDRVPATLDEVLVILNTGLTPVEKGAWTNMPAAKMFDMQHKLARTLRREWSINDESTPLRNYFRNLGLDDAEEISLLCLDAYWRMYNNEAVPVEELVREYLED